MDKSLPPLVKRVDNGKPPEEAGPKSPLPIAELRRDRYDTAAAIEAFENCLLAAAGLPLDKDPNTHPLILVQAAKALVGLRPDRPSRRLVDFAIDLCAAGHSEPWDRDLLQIAPDKLGLTVSVGDLEEAILAGDPAAARENMGRLLQVTANQSFMFDILLDVASRQPAHAGSLVPFMHYARRAVDFVGAPNLGDFLLPALEVAVNARAGGPPLATTDEPLSPWEALPYLGEAPLEVVVLAAHAAQIAADEHVKGPAIQHNLGRTLAHLVQGLELREVAVGSGSGRSSGSSSGSSSGRPRRSHGEPSSVEVLISLALKGEVEGAAAVGYTLGESGEREWILDVLEQVDEARFTPRLILWADAFRMLYRTAPEEHYGLLGELAGAGLAGVIGAGQNEN